MCIFFKEHTIPFCYNFVTHIITHIIAINQFINTLQHSNMMSRSTHGYTAFCTQPHEFEVVSNSYVSNSFDSASSDKENTGRDKHQYSTAKDADEVVSDTSSKMDSETDTDIQLQKQLTDALCSAIEQKSSPPVSVQIQNTSMSDKSDLTMEDSHIKNHFKKMEQDLINALTIAMESKLFEQTDIGTTKTETPSKPPLSLTTDPLNASPIVSPLWTKERKGAIKERVLSPKGKIGLTSNASPSWRKERRDDSRENMPFLKPEGKLNIQLRGISSVDDTATMTTMSEYSASQTSSPSNILTSRHSNLSVKKEGKNIFFQKHGTQIMIAENSDVSLSSSTIKSSCASFDTVTDNFRFERLHSYGKRQLEVRRELAVIQEIEKSKRETKFNLRLQERQKRQKMKAKPLPPVESRGRRIHDRYATRKNEAGKKLREEIQRRNELKAQRRQFDIKL